MQEIDYLINKFEAIPEEKWTTGTLRNKLGQSCVLGHCGVKLSVTRDYIHTDESEILQSFLQDLHPSGAVAINDCWSNVRPERTPKQRILGALKDIKTALED